MAKLTDEQKRERYCPGCRQDFYNGNNPYDIKECWSLSDSKVGWQNIYRSVHQIKPTQERTLHCYVPELKGR